MEPLAPEPVFERALELPAAEEKAVRKEGLPWGLASAVGEAVKGSALEEPESEKEPPFESWPSA